MTKSSIIALCALLTACGADVSYYPPAPQSGDSGQPARPTGPLEVPESVTTGQVPEPCAGHAQCWPYGYCDGSCKPQDAHHCLVDGELQDCGTRVCCDFGDGDHECLPAGDCEPDGGPLPPD